MSSLQQLNFVLIFWRRDRSSGVSSGSVYSKLLSIDTLDGSFDLQY
jgi:hypothetical protein